MAFCRVVIPLLVISVICCQASNVPVYIWGELPQTSAKSNPLTTFNTHEFGSILKKELSDDPLILVFTEQTLSVEDFSLKNDGGETSFPYLQSNVRNAIYLPSVHNALHVLKKVAKPLATDHIELTKDGLSEEIAPQSSEGGRFVFIDLKDAREDESRAELLRRHDQFMQETIARLSKDEKVVAVYTAHFPSWTITNPENHLRVRRATETNSKVYGLNGLRLYAKSIQIISGNSSTPLSSLTSSSSEFNTTTMNTTMVFDNTSIVLNFNQKGGYWFFDTVILNMASLTEELFANDEVFAIMGFSYRCQQFISFSSINETKSYTLSFEDLKIQPFFEPTNTTQAFGDSFNCVGFFSAPIWAGLFVTFILLLITFYGIMMMMDIRTMDRFDDPKGKTITINAAE